MDWPAGIAYKPAPLNLYNCLKQLSEIYIQNIYNNRY